MSTKEFTPKKELLEAAKTVFLCMAFEDTVRPVVEKYQGEIIKKHQFKVDPEHREKERFNRDIEGISKDWTILTKKHSYLMSDEDADIFYKELHAEHLKNGFGYLVNRENDPCIGYCPLLIAESNTRDAKHELLKEAEYITNIDASKIWKLDVLKKMEDLTLQLCAPFIDSKEVMNNL